MINIVFSTGSALDQVTINIMDFFIITLDFHLPLSCTTHNNQVHVGIAQNIDSLQQIVHE